MAARKRDSLSQRHKDGIKAAALINRLTDCANGKAEMSAVQVQAAQVVLKKLIPDLSAVEQTTLDDRDTMTPEQIMEQIKLLVDASPDMRGMLLNLVSKQIDESSTLSH